MLPIDQDPQEPGQPDQGGAGNDTLGGTAAADTIYGLGGHDKLYGYAGADKLYGGEGNDLLTPGAGDDYVDGGPGVDTVSFAGQAAVYVTVDSNGYYAKEDYVGIENAIGTSFGDTLNGSQGANVLDGAGGNDVLSGFAGNDTLRGGEGGDWMQGFEGADVLTGGMGGDTFAFAMFESYGSGSSKEDSGRDWVTDFQKGTDKLAFFDEEMDDVDVRYGAALFDTNKDGSVGAGDAYCTVSGGNLTLDWGEAMSDELPVFAQDVYDGPGVDTVTLAGVTSLGAGDFVL